MGAQARVPTGILSGALHPFLGGGFDAPRINPRVLPNKIDGTFNPATPDWIFSQRGDHALVCSGLGEVILVPVTSSVILPHVEEVGEERLAFAALGFGVVANAKTVLLHAGVEFDETSFAFVMRLEIHFE